MMKKKKQQTNEYSDLMIKAIKNLDIKSLDKIVDFIWESYKNGRTMFFAGNGGSASTASHLAADLGKNTTRDHKDMQETRMRTISMCDNVAWITAVSNDMSYDDIFVEQLKSYAKAGDVLFIISGSGNSMNVVKAAMWARDHKLHSIGILGFDGGIVKNFLELTVIVGSYDYGIVESMHSYIHHFLVEKLKKRKKDEVL
jgi:D-sedoheptulose 7-phosphate isomerase